MAKKKDKLQVEVSSVLRLLERYGLCLEYDGDVAEMLKEMEVEYGGEIVELELVRERLCELLEEGIEVI